jgi:hypothetical protein
LERIPTTEETVKILLSRIGGYMIRIYAMDEDGNDLTLAENPGIETEISIESLFMLKSGEDIVIVAEYEPDKEPFNPMGKR